MSAEQELLRQTVDGVLTKYASNPASTELTWAPDLFATFEELGLADIDVPLDSGGSGGDLSDAAVVVRLCAASAAPIPIEVSALVAPWLRRQVGLPHRPGPVAVVTGAALAARPAASGWTISGSSAPMTWAGVVPSHLVVASTPDGLLVAEVPASESRLAPHDGYGAEPRHVATYDITVEGSQAREAPAGLAEALLLRRGLASAVQMAGAMDQVLALTRQHVIVRRQFGRPLTSFQAVRQHLAMLAGEVAVAGAAADGAVQDVARGGDADLSVMAARVRTAGAASAVATLAHQLHGAMGFTREHALQRFTRRLWSWRDEHATEGEWQERLGARIIAEGADALWPSIAR